MSTQTLGGGLQNNSLATLNSAIVQGFPTQGNVWWVRPRTGVDSNNGLSPVTAFKTLAFALSMAVANQNDVILLCAEGNTASTTTDYQNVTLDWNKNLVHLIGVNAGAALGQRSRVALSSGYATASNLFTLSAAGCLISNIEFFAGVASALPTGCMSITGERNHVKNCQIAGMGNAANDIAGAYSLLLNGGSENLIEDCTIGVDTVTLGAAANSQILTAGGGARNELRNCKILTYTNHATNNVFVRVPASTIDRWLIFNNCVFLNPTGAASTLLTQAAVIASGGSPSGSVILIGAGTGIFGATDWNSTDSGNVIGISGSVTAGTFGLATAVTR